MGAKLKKENDLNKLIEDAFFKKSRDCLSRFYFSIKIIPFLIRFFLKTNISANQITWLGFFCHVFGGFCFCFGNYIYLILGTVLIQLCWLLDNVDGPVASIKGTTSNYGRWLDGTVGLIGICIMLFGAGLGIFYRSRSIIHLCIGIIGSLFFVFEQLAISSAFTIKPEQYVSSTRERIEKKLKIKMATFLRGYPAIYLWLSVGALLNLMYYVFLFYFVLFHGVYFARMFVIYKKHLTG